MNRVQRKRGDTPELTPRADTNTSHACGDGPAPAGGYGCEDYARSLAEFGRPRRLAHAGGWVIDRPVPGRADLSDAMGPYPLFSCEDWSGLDSDLAALEGELVSLTLVTDPFGDYREAALAALFPDVMRIYKPHFIVDLSRPLFAHLSGHHRRDARRALRGVSVEVCADPAQSINEWTSLYDTLVKRHGIRGIAAFSDQSLLQQFKVPGLTAMQAKEGDNTVAMQLWFRNGPYAYYHLSAANERGYTLSSSYALVHHAIEYFARAGCEYLDLGAGAGANPRGSGLTRFKQGWSTGTRPVYLCGRILDRLAYDRLSRTAAAPADSYFPAYRRGEFQ